MCFCETENDAHLKSPTVAMMFLLKHNNWCSGKWWWRLELSPSLQEHRVQGKKPPPPKNKNKTECQTTGQGEGEGGQAGSQKQVSNNSETKTYEDRIYTAGWLQSIHTLAHTYCERGEGHAHAPKAIESQGNEDKDREFCKQKHVSSRVCRQPNHCKLIQIQERYRSTLQGGLTIWLVGSISNE